MRVTRRRLDLKYTVIQRQNTQIVRATAAIKDEDILLTLSLLVKTVRERSRCRLIDNPENIETRDDTGVLCRLAL